MSTHARENQLAIGIFCSACGCRLERRNGVLTPCPMCEEEP